MRAQQLGGILVLLAIIASAVTYKSVTSKPRDPGLQEAQLTYELEKLQLKQHNLKRYDTLKYYGIIGLLGVANVSLLILAGAYARAKLKRSSVHTAHIGQHGTIPVHHKDLQDFYPIAANLSQAEIEAATSTAHNNAYQISRQMIEDVTNYTRVIGGKRGVGVSGSGQPESLQTALPEVTVIPTFGELLENGIAAPGKPLVLGFHQGQAQYRSLKDLKSLAISGWQGSGKTMSTAYIVASSVVAYGVQVYIVDPHKNHHEGLYPLIKPLEKTGHVTVINPFDTPTLINNLNKILDRRLAGQEPSEPGILLVIDELARLAKMDCFDVLVTFLERCTEETRKANITFVGGSHKWTARHFKGRADIRGCMNSMLIHKSKPSQADLLLEDSQDKNLVKQIQRPGEAILVTDFANPVLVSMPHCTVKDMQTVAKIVKNTTISQRQLHLDRELDSQQEDKEAGSRSSKTSANSHAQQGKDMDRETKPSRASSTSIIAKKNASQATPQKYPKDVIPFDVFRKKRKIGRKKTFEPTQLTVEQIREQFQKRKQRDPGFTQKELGRQIGLSVGHLSNILRGKQRLTTKNRLKLYKVLFLQENLEMPTIKGNSPYSPYS